MARSLLNIPDIQSFLQFIHLRQISSLLRLSHPKFTELINGHSNSQIISFIKFNIKKYNLTLNPSAIFLEIHPSISHQLSSHCITHFSPLSLSQPQHENTLYIYTDGSKALNKAGLALVFAISSPSQTTHYISLPSPSFLSIFDIEAFAIFLATNIFSNIKNSIPPPFNLSLPPDLIQKISSSSRLIIFSDSLSTIKAIKLYSHSSSSIISHIIFVALKSPFPIFFNWIPAHSGFCGNEIADFLAKRASDLHLSSHISNYYTIIPHSFNLSICSNFLSNSLSSQFSLLQSKFNTLKVLFPTHNHFQRYLLSKPNFLFVLARLMSNSLPTKDNLFSWNQSKSPLCNHCRIKDTILHTLFHCTKFRNLRITLQLSINLSSNNFNTVLTLASNSTTLVNALVKFFHVAFYCFSPDDDRYDPIDSVSKRSFLIKHRSR
jgi:hypothetical protein